MSGSSGRGERKQRIDQLRTGAIPLLVATQLADEGLDVPELDCAILAAAGKASNRATQRAGRTARPKGAEPVVFDLVDSGSTFQHQWDQRARAYRATYGRDAVVSAKPLGVTAALQYLTPRGGTTKI